MEGRSVVMIGATGAVGGCAVRALLDGTWPVSKLTLLGRRALDGVGDSRVEQHVVDLKDPESYRVFIHNHDAALCTVGVGEPSNVSRETFVEIDKDIPLSFGRVCAQESVKEFSLLSSVGVSPSSRSFFLRTKGELEEGLKELGFDRLNLFHPSMILTPTNRYGFAQAVTLQVWPKLSPLLCGPLRPYRGVRVEDLGRAMAAQVFTPHRSPVEVLEWDDIQRLVS